MDYNDLALFTRVVERGSFTAAAHAAGLPKSSVTRGIARLERELGVRLIQRTTRQRGVTDAGRELYERSRAAVGALEEATEAVRQHGQEPRGVVRVTAPADMAMIGLPEAVAKFVVEYPSIHLELLLSARVIDLVAEGVDLGIRAGKLADSSLIAKKVGSTHGGLFASKAYLRRRGRPKRLAELSDHDCVLFRGRGGHAKWTLEGPRGEQTVEVGGPISVDDFSFMRRTLETGLGIGSMPLFAGVRECALERILPDYRMEGAPLHIVMPAGGFIPARVAAVRDFLAKHLAAELAAVKV